jgi:hypothetical protein
LEGHRFTGYGKNSDLDLLLKGRGFQPRRKVRKINDGFSRCRKSRARSDVFRSIFSVPLRRPATMRGFSP